jgi:hypothetical protein
MLRCTAKRCLEARTVAMSSFEARLRVRTLSLRTLRMTTMDP